MARFHSALVLVLACSIALAGCIGSDEEIDPADVNGESLEESERSEYAPPEPEPNIEVEDFSELIPVSVEDVDLHVRVVKPADVDEVPVVVEFTPYNAPGEPMFIEPQVNPLMAGFASEFVERGFAFAYVDARGTSDSGGCLDLRGSIDIQDAYELTEWLGTQEWSNGKVGFIGASYPGSMAHIAAIANNDHLGGVIPVVASTSFYDYHHKNGVPNFGNLLTNVAYNAFHAAPSSNPHYENWLTKQAYQATQCDQAYQTLKGFDTSGTYDAWWADRDLNPRVDRVEVPVLMAQGLQDWNVKPDHIDPYFNALETSKTLVAPQMGHSYPGDAENAYGDWWEFAVAFFDETLNGVHTGWFDENLAYVEDTDGSWHVYEDAWPPQDAPTWTLNLTEDALTEDEEPHGTISWYAPPAGQEDLAVGENTDIVLETAPLEAPMHTSGTPFLNLTIVTEEEHVHLVAILEVGSGDDFEQVNHGYLNPTYREGLDQPQRVVPGQPTPVTIDMFPQEDILHEGDTIRLTLASTDDGNTVPDYDPGQVTVLLDGERPAQLEWPLSPLTHGAS